MTKAEALSILVNASSSGEIRREHLIDYRFHFGEFDQEQLRKIFNPIQREIIGGAITREFEAFYKTYGDGYNHVEFPTGGKVYRNRQSNTHKMYQELIPDNTSVETCKKMLSEMGMWGEIARGEISVPQSNERLPYKDDDDAGNTPGILSEAPRHTVRQAHHPDKVLIS